MKRLAVIPFLIGINILVFAAWYFLTDEQDGVVFMYQNFLVSWDALVEGRPWTLLTSVFSHNMLLHIFINMYVLSSFGPIIEESLGSVKFLAFYLVAGIFSSFCHAAVSAFILDQPQIPALGASGAISGLILLFALLYPRQKILILGIIPMPAIGGALLFMGLDIWGLVAQAGGGGLPIGHGAHLGGALVGVITFYLFLKNSRRLI